LFQQKNQNGSHKTHFLTQDIPKRVRGRGSAPNATGEAHSAVQTTVALDGHFLAGRGRRDQQKRVERLKGEAMEEEQMEMTQKGGRLPSLKCGCPRLAMLLDGGFCYALRSH